MERRQFLLFSLAARARLTRVELIPVRATERTVWLIARLHSDAGVSGLGEASDAFGFAGTSVADAGRMQAELDGFFSLLRGRAPSDIEWFRKAARERAKAGGLVTATAFSALEQAMWDLSAKLAGVPVHKLLGGKRRDRLPVYANINRATKPRTPAGFAATAKRAASEGFRSVKLAPFDGYPDHKDQEGFVAQGIDTLFAVREAVGNAVGIMVDCHSFFDVALTTDVARKLEPVKLKWFEEPVAPTRTADTLAIRKAIRQEMAGGETLFGVEGFRSLCRERAVHTIMPDAKHCGGLAEMMAIAKMAGSFGVAVAPHNPSGPVATMASIQVCAAIKNFQILELQWGEVAWRGSLVKPAERFANGEIAVPETPGFGIELNDELATQRIMSK